MNVKTSITSPIEVAWLASGTPGKVGLTFAPGKHDDSKFSDVRWQRDLGLDLERLVRHHHAGLLVCLLEDHELESLKIVELVSVATRLGLPVRRLPIVDGGVLPSTAPVRALVGELASLARAGTNVVIHCRGGLGRAGTIGGCTLVGLGLSAEAALAALKVRDEHNCPETGSQRDFIRRYEREGREASRRTP